MKIAQRTLNIILTIGVILLLPVVIYGVYDVLQVYNIITIKQEESVVTNQTNDLNNQSNPIQSATSVRLVANGDILYHDLLYWSAKTEQNTYDFNEQFRYAKEWLEQADLAIGDFEGTISPEHELSGYPLFNAPKEIVGTLKWAGYDMMDLAHNHILDSGLQGLQSTANLFKQADITPFGVFPNGLADDRLTIKEIKGIKIAFLGYSYGFNNMEQSLSNEDYQAHLSDLDITKIERDIKRAEQEADITIVMPQMGVEYALEPNQEQKTLYHQMIDWGADIILGGHPHVIEPAEIVEKDHAKKLIIYSMGNFISNQRLETIDNLWTERGVLMDITLIKENNQTQIQVAKAHPTWVNRVANGKYTDDDYPLYDYHVYILEDFIEGGKYRQQLDEETKARIDQAYKEIIEHVQLNW